MKNYLKIIKILQNTFLGLGILMMLTLPIIIVFYPDLISDDLTSKLYLVSHITIFFVMTIRPIADILINIKIIRPLVILRKGVGVLSASVVLSFILVKIIIDPAGYFKSIITLQYWSFNDFLFFAHAADISAILLMITSNNLSKRILKGWWKGIQRLSYVYFYASSIYVFVVFNDGTLLLSMFIVTLLTLTAYACNQHRIYLKNQYL